MKAIFASLMIVSMALYGCGSGGTNAQSPKVDALTTITPPTLVSTTATNVTVTPGTVSDADGARNVRIVVEQNGTSIAESVDGNISGLPSNTTLNVCTEGDVKDGVTGEWKAAKACTEVITPPTAAELQAAADALKIQQAFTLLEQRTSAGRNQAQADLQAMADNGYDFTKDKAAFGAEFLKIYSTSISGAQIGLMNAVLPFDKDGQLYFTAADAIAEVQKAAGKVVSSAYFNPNSTW